MRNFVMGDIHGAYKALKQCLLASGFNYEKDCLVQLGDVVDGNADAYECVEELLKIKHLIAIKGNHDEWFNTFISSGDHPQSWAHGGKATALSYLKALGLNIAITPKDYGYHIDLKTTDIPETHCAFFKKQQFNYIDNYNNCFVHGGFKKHLAFTNQQSQTYLWDRSLWIAAMSYEAIKKNTATVEAFKLVTPFNKIFIGHTNTINWSHNEPMKAANIYNLDTGAGHGGKLTIMDVQTKKFWQSEAVRDLYKF